MPKKITNTPRRGLSKFQVKMANRVGGLAKRPGTYTIKLIVTRDGRKLMRVNGGELETLG